jgi:uncharacterized protein YigE (DUF2233 family)
MSKGRISILVTTLFVLLAGLFVFATGCQNDDGPFVVYRLDTKKQALAMYWRNDKGETFKSIGNLKQWLEKTNKRLVFAMNGGMYKPGNLPLGLFIENEKPMMPIDSFDGSGNFYLKPNGIFYVTRDNTHVICSINNFDATQKIKFATQSGPMLVIDGKIHPAFKEGSINKNIRNGVGILPGNKVVFAMSKQEINFYDFARFFESLGCKNALYLDGLVSRTYLPEKNWIQTDGDFGVIIGVAEGMK